ncbi:Saccharopine dehydrogenase-domain-containing protein [Lophiotrema nucula]|uniref:Saccharopine dehydrogenase-domain-containing protein n=1 Tax=Lophiotrema nucula TaxID=690887 RepID=A0A6A5ZK33_9PLEO|nr:Saccharopine dehydrogenase-domain-containing protein [Lophiotrema nucula]
MTDRPYELVLLGATGYTGTFTAEYVQEHVASNLNWAIAGRNEKRLRELAEKLKAMNPDRIQPAVEVVEVKNEDLWTLAKKTKVLMTTLGPYAKYGEPVVKACVEAGTHYLDVTGEITFTYEMMRKYDRAAKDKGVCIVPQCGIDSVPSDILAYLCAKTIRDTLNVGIRDCVNSLQKLTTNLSGGTITSLLGLVEAYPFSTLKASIEPSALCPIDPPKAKPSTTSLGKAILGWRRVKDLGILTDSPQAVSDVGIVYRSWGLFDSGNLYGPNFTFTEYMRASNIFVGALVHYGFLMTLISFLLPPVRALIKRVAFKPGDGPSPEDTKNDVQSYKAIATADHASMRRSYATLHYDGSMYYMTAITLTEAALVISRGGDCLGKRLGGMITPATLEMEYVERLQKADIEIEWGMLDG